MIDAVTSTRGPSPFAALRLLLWLKLTLGWRAQRSSKLRGLSIVLFVVMLIPLCFVAYGIHWVLGYAPPAYHQPIVRDSLAVIFILWILAPLLGFQMNESYDLTKLFNYPLSYGQIFFGSVIGGLIDPPVLLAAPPMIAVFLAYNVDARSTIIGAVLLFLFLLQTISTAQAITIVLVGFLRSRRFRDITIVVFPIFGLAYYVGQQVLVRQFQFLRFGDWQIFTAPVWRLADYLPPGLAASGMQAALDGNWSTLLVDAGGLLLAIALAMAIAASTLRRLFLGDVIVTESASSTGTRRTASTTVARPRWLPADIAAMTGKELSYLHRDPQYKAVLVQMIYMVVVIAIPFLLPAYSGRSGFSGWGMLGNLRLYGVAGALVLSTAPLIFNLFGAEGAAVTVLFSFPTPRRRIFLAKNLAHATTLLILNLVGLTVAAVVTGQWEGLPLVLAGVILTLPILLAAGNLISVRLPHRMLVRGQRWQRGGAASVGGDGAGCAYAFIYLLAYMVTGIAVAPVPLAIVLPSFTSNPSLWYAVGLPLAAVYSFVIYAILLGVAETWLMNREPEIAAAVIPPD